MKKLNKLFAILFAVLGVSTTAKAYTVANLTAAGWAEVTSLPKSNEELSKYYYVFYATEADLMLAEETHGTQENQLTGVYRTPADPSANKKMVWTLEYNNTYYYGIRNLTNPLLLLQSRENAPYRVQAAWEKNQSEWTQWDFIYADGTWTIKNKLAKGADANDHIGPWDTKNFVDGSVVAGNKEGDDIGNFKIYAISRYTFDNINTDFDYESATAIAPLNITPLIVNAGFEYAAGWWNYTVSPGVLNNNSLEYWNGTASSLQFDINQSISKLPAGKYELKAELFNSYNGQAAGTNGGRAYLYASVYDGTTTTEYKTVVEPTTESTLTSHQTVLFVPSGIASENIKVTIGVKTIGTMDARWFAMDNFQLFYCGVDLTALMQNLQDKITEAEAIDSESLNTGIKGILATAINNAKNVLETEEDIMAKSSALDQAMSLANSSIAPYADINSLITLCETYAAEDYSVVKEESTRTTFTAAISTATTDKENATTVEALNDVYSTLETARQTYVETAFPTAGNKFDVTYRILNAEIVSKDNWATNANLASNVDYTGAPDIYALDRWDAGSTNGTTVYAKQTINNLANGVYTLTAMARGNGADMYYVYATSNDIEYKEVVIGGGDTGNPWGLVTVPNIVVVNGAPMELGLKGTNNNTWFSVDNFKLYRSYDATTIQSVLTDLLTEANTMVSKPMNATIKKTLNSTIQATDATATDPATLDNMIDALNEAMTSAETSINDYAKLKKYIDMTAEFTDVTTYETKYNNGEYTTDDVETVRRELNVMRFDAASLIFPNNIEVTGWEGTMGGKNTGGQHWDGTTTGDNATKYYDNNSWNGTAHSTTTDITLPAGSYVLKAALRSNANTTLRLTVLDKTVDIEGKGDQGYGIDVNGKATFAEDATYANDDKGRGWEWEFVMFELTEETTVTLTVECDYNGVYGWASFSDITLWMDDDTYVTVYRKELDAPLAEAKVLLNTLPMGDAENTALAEAIAVGEGDLSGPSELNAAVDGLKTAVANANTWRNTYYTEKDKLVAALERFEADYNDGANGCLYHLQTSVWETVITEVQEAAVTKDTRDSYENLEKATEELIAALDAAQVSIDMYAKLKAEISYAKEYTPIIEENVTAHTTAINTAQGIYDAAETGDSAYVSNLITNMQQYKVLDYTYVMESYNRTVELGDWTGSTGTGKGEHWSGNAETVYFDYSRWSGDAQAYEVTQTITLPAGEYVLMAAGRAADVEGTEAYIKVGDTKVNFATKSSYGRGIDTDGKANFSSEGTYGRSNEGYGWEYRFIEFTLTTGGDVTLTAGMNIVDSYNPLSWAGVCTPVLLTPDLDIAYEGLQAAIDACQPIWEGVETEYENNILPGYQNACTNKSYNFVSEIMAATEEVRVEFAEYVRNTANDSDRSLEFTELIVNASCENNGNWDGSGRSTMTGEHWSGNVDRVYFAQNHQNGAARAQTITLPYKGFYLLKVAVRAVAVNSYAEILINGESNKTSGAHGRTGGTIATDGTEWESVAAGTAAGKTFANNGAGYGWIYDYVYFETTSTDADATIAINLSDKDTHKAEGNCGGMELYFIGKNYSVEENNVRMHYGEYTEDITAVHTTHDVTNATMSNLAVNVAATPNALIIANEGQVSNANNVIVDGTAASLVLNDGGYAFNTTADFTATALNYAREFTKDTWLTVCLPFAYPIPENVKVETLGAIDLDTKTFTFDEVKGTMEANTPYLIKNSTETAALFASFGNVEVEATPAAMNVTITADNSEHQGEFIGTYTTVKTDALMEDGAYDILFFGTDGQLYYLSQDITTKVVNIKPFRAYIRLPKGAINWSDGQQARVRHRNSEMTDIESSTLNAQPSTEVYDLMGRKVNTMKKGNMYIVNGRKVVIR